VHALNSFLLFLLPLLLPLPLGFVIRRRLIV
jgi:hypothetical protein